MTPDRYSDEPAEPERFTREMDRAYSRFASIYDVALRRLPVWKTWIEHALPHVVGPRVLEISCGTGHLVPRLAERFEAHGLDYNREMVETARRNLARGAHSAALVQGNVEQLPYADATFDSIVNTMAFSGYPRGRVALAEMTRVLRHGGRLVLIDVSLPEDRNWLGMQAAALAEQAGDILRDMGALFDACGLEYSDEAIGAWKSLHLWVATRP